MLRCSFDCKTDGRAVMLDEIREADAKCFKQAPFFRGMKTRRQPDGVEGPPELVASAGIVGADLGRARAGGGPADHQTKPGPEQVL
mgnify:CR=1 FL=1